MYYIGQGQKNIILKDLKVWDIQTNVKLIQLNKHLTRIAVVSCSILNRVIILFFIYIFC